MNRDRREFPRIGRRAPEAPERLGDWWRLSEAEKRAYVRDLSIRAFNLGSYMGLGART